MGYFRSQPPNGICWHPGGKRVEDYFARQNSHRKKWQPPPQDALRPEAEWGFEPRLREDLERFASKHGFRVRRILFDQPEQLSPFVADFYRWWNRQRSITDARLLVESFIVRNLFGRSALEYRPLYPPRISGRQIGYHLAAERIAEKRPAFESDCRNPRYHPVGEFRHIEHFLWFIAVTKAG